LDKLGAARLLALRMHVARYIVRAGATQRSAIAFLDEPTLARRGALMKELLEAGGALNPDVLPLPTSTAGALPLADVHLFGDSGRTVEEVAASLRAGESGASGPQVWAINAGVLLAEPGPGIVDSVEAILRIVMPEALGANGTPPPAAAAIRVA